MEFKKATLTQSRLRLAIFGPAGAGKTFTSLSIATGMGGKIGVIDTERGSASKYADRFNFDVLDLDDKSVNGYISAINLAANAGYDILIIDSLSHAWQELLVEVERLARAKYRGNTWGAWSEGTPKQRALVDALLTYPNHVIATMRVKTEWEVTKNDNKITPVRVGLAPEQGKGIEYEFDVLMNITPDHVGHVIKDRTGRLQDKIYDCPGAELGREIMAWMMGETAHETPKTPAQHTQTQTPAEHAVTNAVDQRANDGNTETVRPYSPEALKSRLEAIADYYRKNTEDNTNTQGKRGVIVRILNTTLGGDTQRYELLKFLFGNPSLVSMGDAEISALWRWLAPYKTEDGEWLPSKISITEAKSAHEFALKSFGQEKLL